MFGCCRRPEIASDRQELEFCTVMTCMITVLRTKFLSSRRAVTALDAEHFCTSSKKFSYVIQHLPVLPTRIGIKIKMLLY